jgi:hypothetical protein
MSRPPHPPRLYNSNYTWWRVQIWKLHFNITLQNVSLFEFSYRNLGTIVASWSATFVSTAFFKKGVRNSMIAPTCQSILGNFRCDSLGYKGFRIGDYLDDRWNWNPCTNHLKCSLVKRIHLIAISTYEYMHMVHFPQNIHLSLLYILILRLGHVWVK